LISAFSSRIDRHAALAQARAGDRLFLLHAQSGASRSAGIGMHKGTRLGNATPMAFEQIWLVLADAVERQVPALW